jgi:hypothetical protein
MRTLRIARPGRPGGTVLPSRHHEVWAGLPEAARRRVLTLLARMIARGVLDAGIGGEDS